MVRLYWLRYGLARLLGEQKARAAAQEAEDRLRFLSEASIVLASSLDYETTLASVAELAVPHVADWCAVHVVHEDGTVRQLAAAHVDPAKVELARQLDRRYPFDPDAPSGAAQVLRSGKSELIPEITDELLEASTDDPELLAIARELGLRSSMVVPLTARGHAVGAITFVSAESGRRFTSEDLALAEDLGRRAALAVDNARLHRDALRVAAEQAAVLAQMADCVTMVDASGRIVYMNEAAKRLVGSDAVGEVVPYETRRLDGSPYPADALPLVRAALGETVLDERWRVRDAGGTDMVLQGSAAPVVTEEGVRLGAVCTYREITGQVSLERQKDEFLATVAHDLKTPLTSIKALAQVLHRRVSREVPPERERLLEGLEGIDRTATRMARLINELLDMTRIQMGRPLELSWRHTDLVALTKSVTNEFQKSTNRHHICVESTVPALVGRWDGDRLERVLANLLSNATKYSPNGGEITVSTSLEQNGGSWAVMAVRDHGIGIPAADLPHIFERFYRGRNVTEQTPGTGIGLAGARTIVEQHGGTIQVDSREGEGATFAVRLPMRRVAD